MKWLSHKFWLWVGRNIREHELQEARNLDIDGAFELHQVIAPNDADVIKAMSEFEVGVGKNLEQKFTGVGKPTFDDRIKKGYDKP